MDRSNQCPLCFQNFSCLRRLQSHLKRKTPCYMTSNTDAKMMQIQERHRLDEIICQYCGKNFARNDSLARHIKTNKCKAKDLIHSNSEVKVGNAVENPLMLEKQMEDLRMEFRQKSMILEKQIAELKEKPSNLTQILNVVCVGSRDNFLDMLTEEFDNFDLALEYIKDCALSSLTGDCKLIEKIYLKEQNPPSIRFTDKSRTKIEYYTENKEKIIDNKQLFGKKIANNLQNSYLKGVNYLINKNLEGHCCPNKFLEDYDLQIWNQHIYDLSDSKYQKKIVNQLNIPLVS